jgi:hypothetical protein
VSSTANKPHAGVFAFSSSPKTTVVPLGLTITLYDMTHFQASSSGSSFLPFLCFSIAANLSFVSHEDFGCFLITDLSIQSPLLDTTSTETNNRTTITVIISSCPKHHHHESSGRGSGRTTSNYNTDAFAPKQPQQQQQQQRTKVSWVFHNKNDVSDSSVAT